MSRTYTAWARKVSGPKGMDRAVLREIADRVRDDGIWQFCQKDLATTMGVSRTGLRRILDRLAAMSLVAFKAERYRGGEAQAGHRFILIRSEDELRSAEAQGFSRTRQAIERIASDAPEAAGGGSRLDQGVGPAEAEGGSLRDRSVGPPLDPRRDYKNPLSKPVPPSDKSSGGRARPRADATERRAVATQGELYSAEAPDQLITDDLAGKPGCDETERVVAKRPRPKRPRRATSLWPEDFTFGAVERAFAEQHSFHGGDAVRLWARFEAHARSRGSVYVDWSRAWQSWVLNEVKFDAERRVGLPKVAIRPCTTAFPDDPVIEFPGGQKRRTSMVRDLVAKHAKNPRTWPPELGAAPGEPGCRVPEHLLAGEAAAV